ncbi:type II secretion system major pseudopilin GspG [Alcanivorax quisquiliarum]|uniref:Type II secretion system core protein G n=1 Tax=Alcanivorax quisquiliarum TaxID=2933565 RepID=A0ABT0E3B6_9GAMM|nr:type II secretion system major pseudopilin GspG [Alcanivorax quisquiliarum]MCK0536317.1 type II secretion system major pseudopilin GspG [Alcanivorax quisquiliarum]
MKKLTWRTAQRGLTLIEIMVVVAIIGLLAAMIVPNVIGQGEQAKVDLAKTNMASIASALDMFRLHNSRYPTTEEGLRGLVERPSSARSWPEGGYLSRIPQDPWGSDYIYISPGTSGPYDLISLGADGMEGGEGVNADLNYRELQR